MSALHVVFRVGAAEYVLPASDVLQLESFAGATPVPGTRPFIAGMVQIRGRVVPVLDLRARFGLAALAPTIDTRVVVVERGGRTVGLLADAAREVVKLAPAQLSPPPSAVLEQAEGFVVAVAQVGPRLLLALDFDKLVGEEQLHGK